MALEEEGPTDMVNPQSCDPATMSHDVTTRGTIASYGEQ